MDISAFAIDWCPESVEKRVPDFLKKSLHKVLHLNFICRIFALSVKGNTLTRDNKLNN